MLKLKKFNPDDVYMFTNGAIANADAIRADFPAVDVFTHVLELNGDICQAVLNLAALRSMHELDPALSEDEAIAVLEEIINTPPPMPEEAADPIERLAAAIEFQNLLNM